MQKIAQHHKQIHTQICKFWLPRSILNKIVSKLYCLNMLQILCWDLLWEVFFPKFFLKTMLWKYLFKSMEELTVAVNFRFLVHHSHPTWMLLTVVLIIAVRGWISHERWYVGKGEVLQLCLLCLQCYHLQFRSETRASVVLS